MRRAITETLHEMGFRDVLQSASAQDAMRILRTTPVAAVISDWDMLGMSGLGLLRWVRSEAPSTDLPFMLITAESDRERVRSATEAGASEYLVKPFTVQDLANKVKRILSSDRPVSANAVPLGERVLGLENTRHVEDRVGDSTILVVDDMPSSTRIIAEILKGDYKIISANSGAQALALALAATPPDLILLDITMPEMDGYEVCRQLKANSLTNNIPVIFLTANDRVEDVVRGLEIGAVDYITKPTEPGILKARVRTHLQLKLAFAALTQQNASQAASAKLREDVERIAQHDLRNPITAIIAGVEMLQEASGLVEDHIDMMRLIEVEAWRALDLVDQSLSLYRMETGSFVLQPVPVDLVTALTMVRQEIMTAFAGRDISIRLAAIDGGELIHGRYVAQGEAGLCHSLFGNLLRNAADASADGATIDVHFAAAPDTVSVTIRNDGAVPMPIRERFFEKYVTYGKENGTGLGTYSAKLVTEAQHGTISMTTDDRFGTTLVVRLPNALQ